MTLAKLYLIGRLQTQVKKGSKECTEIMSRVKSEKLLKEHALKMDTELICVRCEYSFIRD
jgi:hypothetical protein